MTKVTEEFLQRQDEILVAAFNLFRRLGLKRVSMVDIAQAAEVSRTTLYRHFKSKRAIMELILARQREYGFDFLEYLKDDSVSLSEKMQEMLRLKYEMVKSWGDLLINEILTDSDYSIQLHQLQEKMGRQFIEFLRKEQKQGNLSDEFDVEFIYIYLTKLEYLVMDETLQGYYPDLASLIVAVLNISFNGVRIR
ncbi:MAG: TetR/AcrR family transcriptional regulator [Candidatus Stygibacter australis]|nr:TetR/AcrR family transcriptional regulator [Candidatus Stygibacter australis]